MSLEQITELLHKQKLVENIMRNQDAPQQDLIENLTHLQHLNELKTALQRLPVREIGALLDTLSDDDTRLLWSQLEAEIISDVLWELSLERRHLLAPDQEPSFHQGQVYAYELNNGRISIKEIKGEQDLLTTQPIWLDMLEVSNSERRAVGRHFGLKFPDPDDLTDLETSARFYLEENGELHLHSSFLLHTNDQARDVQAAFIIHRDILFTLRNEDLPVFRLQRLRVRSQAGSYSECKDILLDLYDADIENSADSLEESYDILREAGQKVLSENLSDNEATRILGEIAGIEDLNSLIRNNMLNTRRAISFLIRGRQLSPQQTATANQMLRDIESVNNHTVFLVEKIKFLMDATVGFINVNQNRYISQLTIINIVFMPLNLIAGIGGMSEFSMLTKDFPVTISYSSLLLSMMLVGWLTYLALKFFSKRKPRIKL
ncbi:MAG: CorA family divalent cation transporter [Methylococcales bacterium]|nr:CorA family divalent cation transporter [Methylococcales bacterium]